MIRLHHANSSAAMAPLFLLEELGLPYELVPLDPAKQEHKSPDYLRLNPNGLIPTLVDGELVLYETAAILLHLADRAGRLLPPLGSAARAEAYKWLVWMSNSLQATLIHYFYPQRLNPADPADLKARAQTKVLELLQQLDEQLARGGPWLLGAEFSAADCLAFVLCRWTRNFEGRKARDFAHLGLYLQRLAERPALQRVFALEGTPAPYF